MFTKTTCLSNAVLYVEAKGKLDIYNTQDYLEEIKEHLERTHARELVLEFSGITNVASIGLRAILDIYKTMQKKGGYLKLKNVNENVLFAFKVSGFDNFLVIENDSDNSEDTDSAQKSQ